DQGAEMPRQELDVVRGPEESARGYRSARHFGLVEPECPIVTRHLRNRDGFDLHLLRLETDDLVGRGKADRRRYGDIDQEAVPVSVDGRVVDMQVAAEMDLDAGRGHGSRHRRIGSASHEVGVAKQPALFERRSAEWVGYRIVRK